MLRLHAAGGPAAGAIPPDGQVEGLLLARGPAEDVPASNDDERGRDEGLARDDEPGLMDDGPALVAEPAADDAIADDAVPDSAPDAADVDGETTDELPGGPDVAGDAEVPLPDESGRSAEEPVSDAALDGEPLVRETGREVVPTEERPPAEEPAGAGPLVSTMPAGTHAPARHSQPPGHVVPSPHRRPQ